MKNKKKNKITCTKCGYSWKTKSKLSYTCCPNCLRKFKNIRGENGKKYTTSRRPKN